MASKIGFAESSGSTIRERDNVPPVTILTMWANLSQAELGLESASPAPFELAAGKAGVIPSERHQLVVGAFFGDDAVHPER